MISYRFSAGLIGRSRLPDRCFLNPLLRRRNPAQRSRTQKLACRAARNWFLRGLVRSKLDGGLSRRTRSAIGHQRTLPSTNSREQGDDFHPEGCPTQLDILSVALLIVAAVAWSASAYRAMRVNPIIALLYE